MYAVCVTFEIDPTAIDEFHALVKKQATDSLEHETACTRFDVWTDSEKPNMVHLYEIYDDRAAFDLHLASDHFAAFDANVRDLVLAKKVHTWDRPL